MGDDRKWERKNLDPDTDGNMTADKKDIRMLAENETDRDLQKPIQQLLCDVHEEVHQKHRTKIQNLIHANKRMVSMLARVALSNEKSNKFMVRLTWALVYLTIFLLILTAFSLTIAWSGRG